MKRLKLMSFWNELIIERNAIKLIRKKKEGIPLEFQQWKESFVREHDEQVRHFYCASVDLL